MAPGSMYTAGALAGFFAAALPALAGAAEDRVWLGVTAPSEGAHLERPVPFVEVSGWAGAQEGARHDVVLALDVSDSTLAPSGSDIDGDGHVGRQGCVAPWWLERSRQWPRAGRACPEAGDTIRAAQIVAAERLLDRLDQRRTRVGLVTFHGGAKLVAALGASHDQLRRALQEIDMQPHIPGRGTDFRVAIDTALEAWSRALPGSDGHGATERSILFLSDGTPTLPGFGGRPARKALEAAERAGRAGVRIHAFALGPDAQAHAGIYREMAGRTGGQLTRVAQPGEIVEWLPLVNLAGVAEISISNVTSGRSGRAIRTFPDGSFDGYAPLVRGPNRLRVTARGSLGQEISVERIVHFEPPTARSARALERRHEDQERFARALEERTAETRALRAAEQARQRRQLALRVHDEQGKRLELHVEPPAGTSH